MVKESKQGARAKQLVIPVIPRLSAINFKDTLLSTTET
jgi:hypothetical protein